MTKWSRVRRREERRKAEAEERRKAEELQRTEPQIEDLNTQQEKITENVQHSEKRFLKRFSILKKPSQQEKSSENIQQTRENVEQENTQTFKQKPILSQIPRYVYLVAFFALLSGVFYPLITNPAEQNLDNVLKGTAILFLGLTGAILVYKGTTSDKNRAAVVSLGLVLIAVSLALIFTIAGTPV
jgi:flagellar biosynthesis GTPase FlhF